MTDRNRDDPERGLPVTPELIAGLSPLVAKAVSLGMDVDAVMAHLRSIVEPMHRTALAEKRRRKVTTTQALSDREAERGRQLGRRPGR